MISRHTMGPTAPVGSRPSCRCMARTEVAVAVPKYPVTVPALIDMWKSTKHNAEFINFDEVDKYRDFGGVRLEDEILITENGCRVMGKKTIPYHIDELEEFINSK